MNDTLGSADSSIRVVLAELPTMVAAIVREAVRSDGIRIVDEIRDRADLPDVVARQRANIVIVPTETSGVARQYHELLRRNPQVRVLTIGAVPHGTDLYELRLLGNNVGRGGMVAAIHAVMGNDAHGSGPFPARDSGQGDL